MTGQYFKLYHDRLLSYPFQFIINWYPIPVYKTEINDRGNPLRWPRDTLYPQKLALTSPTSGGRSSV
jgi:hypothetical protein